MSEYFFGFVPDDPYYRLNEAEICAIKKLDWYQGDMSIKVNDTVQFAAAGGNLESILCPFCKSDLRGWWQEAMDAAYDLEKRYFKGLRAVTPCCNKVISLQDLEYNFPQGFYTSIIKIPVIGIQSDVIDDDVACEQLAQITDTTWRAVHAR